MLNGTVLIKSVIFVVLWTVEEEGLVNLWSGVTPAILRHVGKFISPNTTTLFFSCPASAHCKYKN